MQARTMLSSSNWMILARKGFPGNGESTLTLAPNRTGVPCLSKHWVTREYCLVRLPGLLSSSEYFAKAFAFFSSKCRFNWCSSWFRWLSRSAHWTVRSCKRFLDLWFRALASLMDSRLWAALLTLGETDTFVRYPWSRAWVLWAWVNLIGWYAFLLLKNAISVITLLTLLLLSLSSSEL